MVSDENIKEITHLIDSLRGYEKELNLTNITKQKRKFFGLSYARYQNIKNVTYLMLLIFQSYLAQLYIKQSQNLKRKILLILLNLDLIRESS